MAEDGERVAQEDSSSQDGKAEGGGGRFSYNDNKELSSKSLKIQNKVYYLDVKENRRGRFVKITEIPPMRIKTRLMLPMSFVPEFKEKLTSFAEFYDTLDRGGDHGDTEKDEERMFKPIKSDVFQKNNRRFHFELRQNKRGYFLKINQPIWNSSQPASRLTIPAQGIADIRNSLSEIVDEFGVDEEEEELNLPESKELRIEHKKFYFDVGNNDRGVFLRVSEVTNNFRASVTVPRSRRGWERIRDVLNELCEKLPPEEDERQGGDYD